MTPLHSPPTACPVCRERLHTTRLSCDGCGTELTGAFEPCEFCALDADDRKILRIFLRSRGNTKEVERMLEVSYPTARARIDSLLTKLGLNDGPAPTEPAAPPSRLELLERLSRGEISVDDALADL
jgi:hypothetical protein